MTVFYVDASRPDDGGDGVTWATAFRHLQSALAVATEGDEIWVAAGTYSPDEGTGQTANDRNSTFRLKDGVAIYGGFVGEEVNRAERNPATHVTTLDGKRISYHVVTSDGNAPTAVLDGFTITGGNADGPNFPSNAGGGIYISSNSQAQFANLTISGNTTSFGGGGVYSNFSTPCFADTVISANDTGFGGGMYIRGGSSSFTNVRIVGNAATATAGGVFIQDGRPCFTNVIVSGNVSDGDGGGVSNGNSCPRFTNVTISGNTAGNRGGGVHNEGDSTPSFTNSIIWGNNTQVFNDSSAPTYTYSLVQGETLAGTGNLPGDTDPLFVAPLAPGMSTGGDYRLQPNSPVRDRGDTTANSTTTDLDGNPRVFNGVIDLGAYEGQAIPAIIYVDKERPNDGGDGLTWATAKRHLQSALALATRGDEIWVAGGTYAPDEGLGWMPNARDATFRLKDGVAIYGGFAGGETLRSERDPNAHLTILTGHGRSYHVVTSDGNHPTTLLDGFTITGGNANGRTVPDTVGGGIFVLGGSQSQFAHLIIAHNGSIDGAGVCVNDSSPRFTQVTIRNNAADRNGGGVWIDGGTPWFDSVVICDNTSVSGGGVGGASGSPRFMNVAIRGNHANFGGGAHMTSRISSRFANVAIRDNHAGFGGGVYIRGGMSHFENVIISRNHAIERAGGVFFVGGRGLTLVMCLIYANSAERDHDVVFAAELRLHNVIIGAGAMQRMHIALLEDRIADEEDLWMSGGTGNEGNLQLLRAQLDSPRLSRP